MFAEYMTIESERVRLRQLTHSDPCAEEWIATDMANFRKTADPIFTYYDHYSNFGTGWLGVVDKQSEQLVGRAGILSRSDVFDPAELEIAYVVIEQYQKKGFGKESATLLLNYAKQNPCVNRVFLGIAPENLASMKIAEFLGMKKEYERLHFGMLHAYYWYRKIGNFKSEQFINH